MSAVIGVGIDIIEISRISRAMEDPEFVAVVLTPKESQARCSAEWLAGRWAAKEAVAKAIGTHLRWHDVEISDDGSGKPVVAIAGLSQARVHVTVSFSGDFACAFAIAEANPQSDPDP